MNSRNQRFLETVEPLRERLWRYLRVQVRGDDELVKDVMSETILTALEGFDGLREQQAALSWLFTIANRVLFKYRQTNPRMEVRQQHRFDETHGSATSPEVHADIALLHDAMRKMSPLLSEAVILADIADMPLEDIRKIQGGSLSAVKSRVSRGREELRAALTDRSENVVRSKR